MAIKFQRSSTANNVQLANPQTKLETHPQFKSSVFPMSVHHHHDCDGQYLKLLLKTENCSLV